uniref:CD226 molecule n=1 Tax=Chelonoidis abingdonii TaxID=106734 RepID=A0A8C0G8B9_CHEAB
IFKRGRFVDATVKLTNNMTLECVYPKTDGITQMSWVKSIVAGKEVIAVSHPLYGVHIEDKYKDRIRFINASSRDKSLNFMKTTEADTGLYLCSITFPKGVWEKVVQVIQLDSFEVPVPPTNHMIIEPGGNVTLRCSYSVGDLVRQVMWERIKADQMDTIVLCNLSEGKTYGSDYQERAMIDCATQESDILVIQNVTSSDSGIYRCRHGGNKTHVMRLTVTSGLVNFHVVFSCLEIYPQNLRPGENTVQSVNYDVCGIKDSTCGNMETFCTDCLQQSPSS